MVFGFLYLKSILISTNTCKHLHCTSDRLQDYPYLLCDLRSRELSSRDSMSIRSSSSGLDFCSVTASLFSEYEGWWVWTSGSFSSLIVESYPRLLLFLNFIYQLFEISRHYQKQQTWHIFGGSSFGTTSTSGISRKISKKWEKQPSWGTSVISCLFFGL